MRVLIFIVFFILSIQFGFSSNTDFLISREAPVLIYPDFFSQQPTGGDTIFIAEDRELPIVFNEFSGNESQALVVINQASQVNIASNEHWSALEFKNCRYIKISGRGSAEHQYGFKLKAVNCGLAFSELTSDCEVENVHINHDGFVGIQAKKDYHGFPPSPVPVFEKLVIHDCLIENVSEGMYLGETKTPGMEFKHVRIFNNILFNNKREGIQIANMTDDVEVYNNLIINSGTDQLYSHGNNLQIGDNTIANVYNNILIKAPENGMIVLGSGDISIHDNYLENNGGIFIDNRTVTIHDGEIELRNNYFNEGHKNDNVTNQNELNPIKIFDNFWYGNVNFLNDKTGFEGKVTAWNNLNQSFNPVVLENPEEYNFNQASATNPKFAGMGPQPDLSYVFNYTPVIDSINDIFINWKSDSVFTVKIWVEDHDLLNFEIDDLPDFADYEKISNNEIRFVLTPVEYDFGKYQFKITVWDQSHHVFSRQKINVIVRNPNNVAPVLKIGDQLFCETLDFCRFEIPYSDANNDWVEISAKNLPSFATLKQEAKSYFLELTPRYIDNGIYDNIRIIADDGFGLKDTAEITINIESKKLSAGMPIYRVNCGGPEIKDSVLNWEGAYFQRLPYEVNDNHHTGSHSWTGLNETGAPDNLFGPWCFDYEGGEEMKWAFPVENGKYLVNLFFAEDRTDVGSIGSTIFDIYIQNEKMAENFDIYQEARFDALKTTFEIDVSSQGIEIEFIHVKNNPKLNGIEIVFLSSDPGTAVNNFGTDDFLNYNGNKFLLYPVPATSYLAVKALENSLMQNSKIELLNLQGEIILSKTESGLSGNAVLFLLDRNRISSGIYMIRITTSSGYIEQIKISVQ